MEQKERKKFYSQSTSLGCMHTAACYRNNAHVPSCHLKCLKVSGRKLLKLKKKNMIFPTLLLKTGHLHTCVFKFDVF